jgi:hypothetical protein
MLPQGARLLTRPAAPARRPRVGLKTILIVALLAFAAFVALVLVLGWLVRPDLRRAPEPRTALEVAAAQSLREVSFDARNPEALPRIE